jgi:hypothetical protein
MRIPDDLSQEFWHSLRFRAEKMLRYGYWFGPRRSRHRGYFDFASYEDLFTLTNEVVQITLMKVMSLPEPSDPITDWAVFISYWMGNIVQDMRNEIVRKSRRLLSLDAPIGQDLDGSGHVYLRDVIGEPAKDLTAYEAFLQWISEELDRRFLARKIRDKRQIRPFVEIVRRLLEELDSDTNIRDVHERYSRRFDVHRQAVALEYPFTPSKATAGNWWKDIREHLPNEMKAPRKPR